MFSRTIRMSNPIERIDAIMHDPAYLQQIKREYFQARGNLNPNRKDKKLYEEWLHTHQQSCPKAHTGAEVVERLRMKLRSKL